MKPYGIERRDADDTIDSISPRIARRGSRYAAGGMVVNTKERLRSGERLAYTRTVNTTGYPPGRYRYYIEYKKLGAGTLIQIATVDFQLR